MIKLNRKHEILLQILFIAFFLILIIPLGNNETFINLIFPNANNRSYSVGWLNFVVFVFAVYSFVKLRKNLKQLNSKWRYLLYLVIFIWLITNIRNEIGEQLMSFRKGVSAVEFQIDNSEIQFQKDTLGMVYVNGHIAFRNFSSDTVAFKGVIHGEDFPLMYNDSIADIHFPNHKLLNEKIKIPPKSSYIYQIKFSTKLKINTLIYSTYNGTIKRIRKLTIYYGNKKKIFNY